MSYILKKKSEIEYDNICVSRTNRTTNILNDTRFFVKYSTFTKEFSLIDNFHIVLLCTTAQLYLRLNTYIGLIYMYIPL